ncbi:ferrous iron transporter B [Haloplasma contractile]|uniref:Fe(2+) transporter FeoB n=1 Tax=Haloplasma contractile SSD-17B TaxID=1033810 RepID=U2E7P6_9MOLU|nr:ferrous iron transporter B [Haloplasma contractile]ERJ10921.1 Ferrous iron transport protein B [Haloplasma contractile SSD-17B]
MKIALAGNPNSGKTTLYNALTGSNEHVANWSGVTVDKREATLKERLAKDVTVVDLPGAYSIRPYTSEESITRDFVKEEGPDVIINVVDATNLNRSLFFTTQLLELGIPLVVALNKSDLAATKTEIDIEKLEEELKCPIVEIVALKGKGLDVLIENAKKVSEENTQENAFTSLATFTTIDKQDLERYRIVNDIAEKVETKKEMAKTSALQETIDHYVTNPFIGILLFVGIMALAFQLSINTVGLFIADSLVAFIEGIQGSIADSLAGAGTNEFLSALLTDGIIGGFAAVIGFLPLIMVLMFILSLVEDSGFLARIAMIFDPLFKKIGLSGKSIIPMIVGYGCAIPGVMSTRTIKNEKQRRMTTLLTPFVPCGAKAPIIALFVGAFFNESALVFGITYLVAFLLIILVGLLIKAITGADDVKNYFIVELPEYRLPSVKRSFLKMMDTGKEFAIRAGTIIVLANTVVFLMGSFDFNLRLVGDSVDNSILAAVASPFALLLIPLGIGVWQLAAAAVTGFIAKEEVVGTLAVVYAMSSAINVEEFELTNGFILRETMGITAVAALAFMFFNLFTPPCFAAIGAMKAELKSRKWLVNGIILQFGVGYLVAMVVYQIGTIITYGELGEGFVASLVILAATIVYFSFLIKTSKEKKTLTYSNKVAFEK